nr:hypothetical protein [Tanacetum cinerariifolium]
MSGTLPPIPSPLGTSTGSPSSPNANRVDTMPNADPTNTTITNVARNVVEKNNDNLPQLLDSGGGSHVTIVLAFDKDDFTSWKIRFLVFLDGLKPYLIITLEDGLFVTMSNLSTPTNPLLKRQNQWSNTKSRLANQDKRLKRPSDTRDTKIAALRLKFNAFKALEGEKVNELCWPIRRDFKKVWEGKETYFACGKPGHFQKDCPSNKTSAPSYPSSNTSFNKPKPYTLSSTPNISQNSSNHQKDYKGKYKGLMAEMAMLSQRIDELTKGKSDKGKGDKGKSDKGTNLENESLKDEISELKKVIEKWTCSKVTLDQLLFEQIPGNIVKALGGKYRRKENNSQKEVIFTKADVSTSAPMITSNFEDNCGNQVSLPPLPKLTRTEPFNASKRLISLSVLTANMAGLTLNTASKEIKKSSNKVSQTYVIKKKTDPKHPAISPDKKSLPSTE